MTIKRTNQELFDHVIQMMRQQGRPSLNIVDGADGRLWNTCVYLSSDGCRCSAGHLMDNPTPNMRGSPIMGEAREELIRSGVGLEQLGLVCDLQYAHDRSAKQIGDQTFFGEFERHAKQIAKAWEFNYAG